MIHISFHAISDVINVVDLFFRKIVNLLHILSQIKVVNRTLSTLLWTIMRKNIKFWEECLSYIKFAYNQNVHFALNSHHLKFAREKAELVKYVHDKANSTLNKGLNSMLKQNIISLSSSLKEIQVVARKAIPFKFLKNINNNLNLLHKNGVNITFNVSNLSANFNVSNLNPFGASNKLRTSLS
ncbi:hypothetical protein CR513_54213, partial [Mucuna pruriens]